MTKTKGLSPDERKQIRLQNLAKAREKKLEMLKQKREQKTEDNETAKEVEEEVKKISVDVPNNDYTYDYSYSAESEELVVQPKKKAAKKAPKVVNEIVKEEAPKIDNSPALWSEMEKLKGLIMDLHKPVKKTAKKSSKTTINIVNPTTKEKPPNKKSDFVKATFLKF